MTGARDLGRLSQVAAAEDIREEWVVTWFPPDKPEMSSVTTDEGKARRKAASESVAEWNPLLIRRLTLVVEEIVPL